MNKQSSTPSPIGRPPLYDAPMIKTAMFLTAEMVDWLKSQPIGMSEKVRELIKKEMDRED
jgi:hypothetical protein